MNGHDAGLKGTLTDSAKSATFVMDELKAGDKVTIAGKEYSIGSSADDIKKALTNFAAADHEVTIDGNSYTTEEVFNLKNKFFSEIKKRIDEKVLHLKQKDIL